MYEIMLLTCIENHSVSVNSREVVKVKIKQMHYIWWWIKKCFQLFNSLKSVYY